MTYTVSSGALNSTPTPTSHEPTSRAAAGVLTSRMPETRFAIAMIHQGFANVSLLLKLFGFLKNPIAEAA